MSTVDININVLELKQFLRAIEVTEENQSLIAAADVRLAEFLALATMASGQPYPFRKELAGITQDMNQVVMAIEKRFEAEFEAVPPDELEARMAVREDGMWKLDAARIMMLLSLVHMSHAIDTSPTLF